MRKALVLALVLVGAAETRAQTDPNKLAMLIPNLFGGGGLTVDSLRVLPDGSTHSGHFNSAFQSEFGQFNVALGSQLGSVPLPSPASGFTYEFDSSLGVFQRSTQSFGPLLGERAETIGRRKLTLGFVTQHFTFDTIEGLDLRAVPAVFTHDEAELGGGRSDVVTTTNSIESSVTRFVSYVTYGLHDRVDVSLAIPIVTSELRLDSSAVIRRIGTTEPEIHYFEDPNGQPGSQREYAKSGSASGLGDVILRVKAAAPKLRSTALAAAVDLRLPTGDEENLLGSGTWGVSPAVIGSWAIGKTSPHVQLAYHWNGESVLAGDVTTGTKKKLPDQITYAAGLDVGVNPTLTLAVDLLGQRVLDSPRLFAQDFTAANGRTFGDIHFETASFSMTNLALGGKVNVAGRLLVDASIVIKLDNAGVRDRLSSLLGVEYSF
jgi:hypothetical protein